MGLCRTFAPGVRPMHSSTPDFEYVFMSDVLRLYYCDCTVCVRAQQGPVLVTQGVKDPLNDAEGRATLFQGLGSQVDVVRLDGGHW